MSHYSNLNQDNKELKIYRPFGPSIGHCKLPQELIDDFNKDCEHLMDHEVKKKTHDFSDELVGNVKQELIISPETFAKWGTYFGKLMDAYIAAHPENHKELQKIVFKSGWYVRTFAGDFNPAHYHTNCHMSCVGYLKLPDGIEEEWKKEDNDHYPSIFPWWMYHMVYPFRSKGERRSFSFNVYGKPKEEEPKPKNLIL